MKRSDFGYFCAGVAVGAFGHAAYPQLKEKLAPYLAGALVFAQQAFGDAIKGAAETAEAMQQGGHGEAGSFGPEFFSASSDAQAGEAA
ncbi:MAG: hypothetical protein ACO3NZ_02625 [Pirellulales bacterium]|jgi:hypothetical protein